MIYAFESSRHRSGFHVLIAACFVVALLLFGISGIEGMAYPLLYQLGAVALLVVGVFFMARYALKVYRYEISESDILDATGQPILDLVITETSGRRITVVARVALRDVAEVEIVDREDKSSAKEKEALLLKRAGEVKPVVFRYMNAPVVASACYISIPSERSVLVIPYDEQMTKLLRGGMGGNVTDLP